MPESLSQPIVHDDLHCHLLPAWDDGPATLDDAAKMARRASESGIRRILVTPHVGKSVEQFPERPAAEIPAATAHLQQELQDRDIDITLVPGAEVTLTDMDKVERIASEPWLTVGGNGRYALVETPLNAWPENLEHLFFELGLRGIIPILAHPERIGDIQRDIGIARTAVSRGVVLQVTARSLVNQERTGGASECARRLLDAGLVSIVASDAHSPRSILPYQVATIIEERVGATAGRLMMVENPGRILSGEPVQLPVPEIEPSRPSGVRSLLDLLTGRRR